MHKVRTPSPGWGGGEHRWEGMGEPGRRNGVEEKGVGAAGRPGTAEVLSGGGAGRTTPQSLRGGGGRSMAAGFFIRKTSFPPPRLFLKLRLAMGSPGPPLRKS